MLENLSFPESTISPTMVGPEGKFQSKGSLMVRKCYAEMGFANTMLRKKAILLIFDAEFTESVVLAKTSKLRRLYIGALEENAEQRTNI